MGRTDEVHPGRYSHPGVGALSPRNYPLDTVGIMQYSRVEIQHKEG